MQPVKRRDVVKAATGGLVLGTVPGSVAGRSERSNADRGSGPGYEIWAADQGTNTLYVYRPHKRGRGEPEFRLQDVVDLGAQGIATPHMISYSSDYQYALTANTGSGDVAVIHTPSKRVVDVIDTGPGSHFAGFTPDDEYIQVDVIGEGTIKRVDADLRHEEFEIVDEINVASEIEELVGDRYDEFDEDDGELRPICHDYTADGYSYHTLGPSYHNAGLAILDAETFELEAAFPPTEVPTNCGTIAHPERDRFYLTAGLPSDPDDDDLDGVGEWYVFDTEVHRPIDTEGNTVGESRTIEPEAIARDSGGVDAHGFWFAETDELELWLLNRETNDGIVVDPSDDEATEPDDDTVERIEKFGPNTEVPPDGDSPDIMWSSPDDEYMFVTLRGPNPLSGDPHAATGVNPGFSVLDIETRELVEVVQPDPENEDSDFHGIGVRPVDGTSNRGR